MDLPRVEESVESGVGRSGRPRCRRSPRCSLPNRLHLQWERQGPHEGLGVGTEREREREREREISKTANFEVGESHHPYVLLRSDSFSSSETFEVVSASDTSAKAETAVDAIFPDDYFLKKNIH